MHILVERADYSLVSILLLTNIQVAYTTLEKGTDKSKQYTYKEILDNFKLYNFVILLVL